MNLNREGRVFDFLLLIIIGAFIFFSLSFNKTAQMFPLYFGLIAFFFVLMNLIVSSMKNPPKYLRFIQQKGALSGISDPTGDEEEEDKGDIPWKEVVKALLWVLAFVIALTLINYLVATFFFLLLMLAIGGKVRWVQSFAIAIGFTAFLYFLFEIVL